MKSRQIFGIHLVYQETFCQSTSFLFSSLSSRFSLEENYWGTASHVYSGEEWKTRTRPRSVMPGRTVSQRFSHLQWRRLFKELWRRPTTTADFWSSLWQIPYTATCSCWKMRFKTEVCTCSQFPTEALQWIKEVEMVDSVGDLKSSCSIKGIRTPDFEVLDAEMASALNRIIHNTQFKRKVSLAEQKAQKEDRFLRGRQITYLIYEYFRVTGANDSVENYADLFTISLRNDDIQEFDSKWDGILLSMTKIPHDDILEGLYKLRIRVSEKLKTGLELNNMEIHQKKAGPDDYHRLKTMVKRSIEQNLRIKNFEARNGNHERNAVVKNRGTRQRAQRTPGDCWQWKANGQCSKGDNCSFRHHTNKRAKNDTAESFSEFFYAAEWERYASRTRSPREKKDTFSDKTSTGFWEQWTFHQILKAGKCCEISS